VQEQPVPGCTNPGTARQFSQQKDELLILQVREKKGQTMAGVVYTDGKMLPPPATHLWF